MKIPKYPAVPDLSKQQINEITKIVFCNEMNIEDVTDLIFVFGSTHPAAFERTLKAYSNGLVKDIIISGGTSGTGVKHPDWVYGDKSEARVIYEKLLLNNVPKENIYFEERSSNSKENILFAKELYDFSKVNNMLFVSKNYAAGRQYRTLKKYLPDQIRIASYPYEISLKDGQILNSYNWMEHPESRSLVFGEYLRILYYGQRGDIQNIGAIVTGLENYIESFFEG